MKKGKIILSAVALIALAGSALAFNSGKRTNPNLYTWTSATLGCQRIQCSTVDQGQGNCSITVPLYTKTTTTCKIYTGSKFKDAE